MPSLISDAARVSMETALQSQFDTFARPFLMYVEANTATISTSLTYSRFGQHDQNAPITEDNTAVTPQSYVVTGCIYYANKQPWLDIAPDGINRDAQQLKLRESDGVVRIKVDATGQALLSQVKLVNLDGFNFQLNSNARPHGLLGSPTRWTYTLEKVD